MGQIYLQLIPDKNVELETIVNISNFSNSQKKKKCHKKLKPFCRQITK